MVKEGIWVVGRQNANIADTMPWQPRFGIRWATKAYNFGCVTASDFVFDSWVSFLGEGIPWKHSRDRGSYGHCHMATIFGFLYMGWTLAPPGKYDWTVRMRRRCGLMSNYFNRLLLLGRIARTTCVDAACCHRQISVHGLYLSVCHTSQPCKNG